MLTMFISDELPTTEQKQFVIEELKNNPELVSNFTPATENEIGAICNYMEHKKANKDEIMLPAVRYKDCILGVMYQTDKWGVIERNADYLITDFLDKMRTKALIEECSTVQL